MQLTRYEFWHEWVLETGQFYAEPHHFDSVAEARKAHRSALAFDWAHGKHRPSVSDLYAIAYTKDEQTGRGRRDSSIAIADGRRLERLATL